MFQKLEVSNKEIKLVTILFVLWHPYNCIKLVCMCVHV
jgi:hypothetical protein